MAATKNKIWSEELGEELVRLVGLGLTINQMLESIKESMGITMCANNLSKWKNPKNEKRYKKEFAEAYAEAFKASADVIEAEVLKIADDTTKDVYEDTNKSGDVIKRPNNANVQRDRLRIDVRKSMMTVRNRDKYGKTDTLSHVGNPDQPIIVTNFGDKKPAEKNPFSVNRISKEN